MWGAAAVGGSIASSLGNTFMQWQNLNYQKDLQKKLMAREDNSIQRRVADLRKAGLSPVLAAGQGAGPGPAISTKPAQSDLAENVMAALQMKQNIAQSNAQIDLANAQKNKALAETDYTQYETEYYKTGGKGYDGLGMGTVKGSTSWAKNVADLISFFNKNFKGKFGFDYPEGTKVPPGAGKGLTAPGTTYGR